MRKRTPNRGTAREETKSRVKAGMQGASLPIGKKKNTTKNDFRETWLDGV